MSFSSFDPIARTPVDFNCQASVPGSGVTTQCGQSLCGASCVNAVNNSSALPTFYVGKAVSIQMTAIGTSPFVWTANSGLPAGLTLSSTGLLAGTPTTAATGTLSVTVTNCGAAGTDTDSFAWTVTACTAPGAPSPSSLSSITAGASFSQVFTSTGSPSPTFTATGMPDGMTMSSGGTLAWASPVVGSYSITVTATNPCGTASRTVTLTVASATTVRKGVWKGSATPTFVAADFTGPSANFEVMVGTSAGTRIGSYVFAGQAGVADVRDVLWIADSLLGGTPTFKVGGVPVVLNPAPDTVYQALTILGVSGQVYMTYNAVNGGQTIDVT